MISVPHVPWIGVDVVAVLASVTMGELGRMLMLLLLVVLVLDTCS